MDLPFLPTLNACCNSLAMVCLLLGWRAIGRCNTTTHRNWMLAALGCSALFLTSYLVYHYTAHAMTPYHGQGALRAIYLFILLTHIPLAMVIVPLALVALWHALHANFAAHKRITAKLLPLWLYVSITGVLIYLMLYVWPQYRVKVL